MNTSKLTDIQHKAVQKIKRYGMLLEKNMAIQIWFQKRKIYNVGFKNQGKTQPNYKKGCREIFKHS